MENKVHVASDSSPTTAHGATVPRKKMWFIFRIIIVIVIITTIVVPVTIVLTRGTENTTNTTTKMILRTTTSHIHHPSTTKPKNDTDSTGNIINISRWKYTDIKVNQTRYWYQLEGGGPGSQWSLEYIIFRAYSKQKPGTEPVYGYHSEANNVWHNTLQMDRMSSIPTLNQWVSDGIKFYCYNTSVGSETRQPIRRYWSQSKSDAFYGVSQRIYLLTSEAEDKEQPGWTFDKILFYALPRK